MDRPDLPLNALRVFEVAMRQGSFTKAAIELRVTQAAVSHQVARTSRGGPVPFSSLMNSYMEIGRASCRERV